MAKSLRKAIILRSKLKNNFSKKKFMKTGISKRGKDFLCYSGRPKKNISIILISKVFLTRKNSGKP